MEFNLADLFECVADRVPDREAIVWRDRRLTFRSSTSGPPGWPTACRPPACAPVTTSACYTYNRPEYLETMLAAYKMRAVPINVNYRYVAEELAYLFANAELVALVHERRSGPLVAVDPRPTADAAHDGGGGSDGPAAAAAGHLDYEDAAGGGSPGPGLRAPVRRRPLPPLHRGHDRHAQRRDVAAGGHLLRHHGRRQPGRPPLQRPEEIGDVADARAPGTLHRALLAEAPSRPSEYNAMALGPLMHASGQWSAWGTLLGGCKVVLYPQRNMDVRVRARHRSNASGSRCSRSSATPSAGRSPRRSRPSRDGGTRRRCSCSAPAAASCRPTSRTACCAASRR